MGRKSRYTTKQGKAILEYLSSFGDEHFTVEQIATHLASQDLNVALTTIYRQLEKLMISGKVRKYVLSGVSSACYQYIPESNQEYLHIKCDNCGKLAHLQCGTMERLSEHVSDKHDFQINQVKTVLYGKCKQCMQSTS